MVSSVDKNVFLNVVIRQNRFRKNLPDFLKWPNIGTKDTDSSPDTTREFSLIGNLGKDLSYKVEIHKDKILIIFDCHRLEKCDSEAWGISVLVIQRKVIR